MHHPPLRGRLLGYVGLMLTFDAAVLWALFSWPCLDALFSGEGRPVQVLANAVLVAIAMAAALGLSVAMPADLKAVLVFWRRRHGFPSRHAFSVLALKLSRYPPETWAQRLGPLPEDAVGQQALWRRLFLTHEQLSPLRQLCGQYLLCYEIAIVSMLAMLPMLTLAAWRESTHPTALIAPLFLSGQGLMFIIAARSVAVDLVRAVLAVEAAAPTVEASLQAPGVDC